MGRKQGPRKGSMQVWPRKRSNDFLPRVNWKSIESKKQNDKTSLMAFIGYKAGMISAFVKDMTADSATKGKKIIVPATVIECPPMKIASIKFLKNNIVLGEVLNDNLDKELKHLLKMPKEPKNVLQEIDKLGQEAENIHILVYSQVKKTELKKTPDMAEIALSGKKEDKIAFIKDKINKEISITDIFQKGILDVRGITTGKGFQGPTKRFGLRFRNHKAEKGVRRPGSIGAWHPVGVRFQVPRAGGMGGFARITYNSSIISVKKSTETLNKTFRGYGFVKSDYIILAGSVQGAEKRQLLLTSALRPTKKQSKKNFELVEIR